MIARCGGECIHWSTMAAGVANEPEPQPIVSASPPPSYPAARARSSGVEPSGDTCPKNRLSTIAREKRHAARARLLSWINGTRPFCTRCVFTTHSTVRAYVRRDVDDASASAPGQASALAAGASANAARARPNRPIRLSTSTTPFFVPAGLAVGLARKGRATPAYAGDSPRATEV